MAPTGAISPSQAGLDLVKTPRMSPQNAQMLNDLRGQIQPGVTGGANFLSQLASGGTEDFWKQLEAPAMRQFNEFSGRTASRFSGGGIGNGGGGPGAMSARRSSGFQNEMSSGAVSLAERLQGKRMGLQTGAIEQLMKLYTDLMGEDEFQYDTIEKPRKNRWGGALTGATSGATAGAAFGPWGAAGGALLGGTMGYFGGR